MARSWRIRVCPWPFATVCRLGDLPLRFPGVRPVSLRSLPKLRTRVRFPSPALLCPTDQIQPVSPGIHRFMKSPKSGTVKSICPRSGT
jgi:hypothetical protein